jgi:hypothetical protein
MSNWQDRWNLACLVKKSLFQTCNQEEVLNAKDKLSIASMEDPNAV